MKLQVWFGVLIGGRYCGTLHTPYDPSSQAR
jgi:hypothetical protein